MLLVLKLILTPMFIAVVTLAGRRWGPTLSGLLVSLPVTSGPISLFLALEYGRAFAAQVAVASLVGQASFCCFCMTYRLGARKWNWLVSTLAGVVVFVGLTLLWNSVSWSLVSASAVLLAAIGLGAWRVPHQQIGASVSSHRPGWDLPARMSIAAVFVLLLTTFASAFGPQLSGLITPFPTSGLVVAVFTHRHQGSDAVAKLLRGNCIGSLAFAGFFLTIGLGLPRFDVLSAYSIAVIVGLMLSAGAFYLTQ